MANSLLTWSIGFKTAPAAPAQGGYSAQAQAYFDRLYTQPTAARKVIYATLIDDLVSSGIFAKLDALYILRAAREQWANENLIQPAYRLTANGGYTFTADEHWVGNGTTGYLDTGFVPSTANGKFVLDSAHLAAYSRTNSQSTGIAIGARTNSTINQSFLSLRNASNVTTIRMNSAVAAANPANTDSTGLFVGRRSDSATTALFRNGVKLVGDQLFASTALPTFTLTIGALNTGGTIGSFDSRQFAAASFGASLSDAEIEAFGTLLEAFYTAIAAQTEPGAGGSDPIVTPSFTTYAYGDSLTQASAFTTQLATQLSRTVNNRGYGSQTAEQIAMRQGGNVPTVTISGNQIVAGSNSITAFNGVAITNSTDGKFTQMLSRRDSNGTLTIKASIAGVVGTIQRTATGGPPSTAETYTFTPDADPGTVSCPAGTDVLVQTQADLAATQIIWSGRNNRDDNNWSVVAEVQKMVDALSTVQKHYAVLAITNGEFASEYSGGSDYINLIASNNELAAAFPDSYLDVRRYLIDDGLTDAGITPTAQDLIDIGHDIVPSSLRADTVHLTTVGYQLVADHVAAFMLAKGW